jgi:anti-sigma regulatory factor (Ser/Thr protein kinase)
MGVLRIEADEAGLPRAMAFVRGGGEEAGLPVERLGELDLVVEELFVNVARYAGAGTVELRYTVPEAGVVEVELADDGRAFDPLARAEPDLELPLEARPVGGLGIFLVRRLTQSLRYCRDGGWNRILFRVAVGGR